MESYKQNYTLVGASTFIVEYLLISLWEIIDGEKLDRQSIQKYLGLIVDENSS